MDSMAIHILQLLISSSTVSLKRLTEETNASKGQIEYRIKKINDFLRIHGKTLIQKNGSFFSSKLDNQELNSLIENVSPLIQLNDKERQQYLLVIILLNEKESLHSLSERLAVSKNTILMDNKKVTHYLAKRNVELVYSRKIGYYLKGNELAIRKIGIQVIREIVNEEHGVALFETFFASEATIIRQIQSQLERVEKHFNLIFTEAKLIDLACIIFMCIRRIETGYLLSEMELGEIVPMVNEEFYENISSLLSGYFEELDSQIEAKFVSIQILSTSLILNRTHKKDGRLVKAIEQAVQQFELLSITLISEKEELVEALYQHIIPASYRIKFGVPDNNPNTEKIIEEYDHIHQLVKTAISPIETFFEVVFPQDELTYITVLFLSFLESDLIKKGRKQAVVVCLQGVSISRLLLENLKELFPAIHFIRYMSLREYYELNLESVDYVFSTVFLDTEKTVFFIRHFLNEQEKILLTYEVEKELGSFSSKGFPAIETKKILEIVGQYTNVPENSLLEQNLDTYFHSLRYTEPEKTPQLAGNHHLLTLLPRNHIQIYQETLTFSQAIKLAAKPLIEGKFIESSYIDKIIADYDPKYPYFVIAPETAIPHAGPRDGVNKLGMSLLKLEKPVYFSDQLPVRLIFMIAPKDKKSHINAVSSLYNFVKDQKQLDTLLSKQYEQEMRVYLETVLGYQLSGERRK